MDPLSDVLGAVRLTGAVFLEAKFTAPWCVTSQMSQEDCLAYVSVPAQVVAYHVVIAGNLLAWVHGAAPVPVSAGEIVLIPRNEVHWLASAKGLRAVNSRELMRPSPDGGMVRVSYGGGGTATEIVCGFLATDGAYNPLIASLPRVLKLDIRAGTSREWIETSVRFAARELAQGRLATSSVMSRLSEVLFVEAVRQYSALNADIDLGWLRGLNDPHVGRALALIHQDVSASWSTDALAKAVALSRSAFSDRFTSLVGAPPIRYITAWRLQAAKLTLRESTRSIAEVAYAIGYGSEEAFSRAFKREFGLSPAQWRKRKSAATGNAA